MEKNKVILGSPSQAMKILGVGRNMMYEDLLRRKDFPAFRIGNKFFVNLELLQDWANKQCSKR